VNLSIGVLRPLHWNSDTIAYQPVDDAQREDRGRKGQGVQRVGVREIENDDFPADGEERDHYNLADLYDVVAAFGHHQKRFLEFERNDHRKDLPKTAWKAE
jgi:hypothetical protein